MSADNWGERIYRGESQEIQEEGEWQSLQRNAETGALMKSLKSESQFAKKYHLESSEIPGEAMWKHFK
jgi:hypothetical protein